ncbi:MAG: glutamate carboxypeptidase [Pseudomonadota bacterium]|nr:glutamate carboxypeptidase [Pseudomonadota bacterium]
MTCLPPAVEPQRLLHEVRWRRDQFLSVLESLCRAESPSLDAHRQQAVHAVLAANLDALGYEVRELPGVRSGGHLYARPRRRNRGTGVQLLLGHYDTVWPAGTLATMPFGFEGDRARGPGVYDMKGGLAQIVVALASLRGLAIEPELTPVVLVNADEEVGSRESGRYVRRLARIADRALVLEPSLGIEGRLKTERKGVARYTVVVHGRAAHAGLDPGAGASAILELSHVIQALFALNDPARGITVNVGTIDGGLRPNVVAAESRAVVDVRTRSAADAERVDASIRQLQPVTPGTSLSIEGGPGRPPLEPTPRNQALFETAQTLGQHLGMSLDGGTAGGGSDGSTASLHTATLDGLGPVGDGAHAAHEYIEIGPTLDRAALLALLLVAPACRTQGH